MIFRLLKNLLLVTVPALLVFFFFLELVFRFVVPASEHPFTLFDPTDGTLRLDPTKSTDGVRTRGPAAEDRARWHVNNEGWNSSVDYEPPEQRDKPLIAIIGDSYVEGFNVNVEETVASVLRDSLRGRCDVYSFGMSGSPLSQYLQMSRYARRLFKPDIYVFTIVHNDFDESVRSLVGKADYLQVDEADDQTREVPPHPYERKGTTRLFLSSALVRYLVYNLDLYSRVVRYTHPEALDVAPAETTAGGTVQQEINANINVTAALRNRAIIERATSYVVRRVRKENRDVPVVFMMDAPRQDIYERRLDSSNVAWLNRMLGDICGREDVLFLDLTAAFARHWRIHHEAFNSATDGHWNALGHHVAADALRRLLVEEGIVRDTGTDGTHPASPR